jgi:hypothetical protein
MQILPIDFPIPDEPPVKTTLPIVLLFVLEESKIKKILPKEDQILF